MDQPNPHAAHASSSKMPDMTRTVRLNDGADRAPASSGNTTRSIVEVRNPTVVAASWYFSAMFVTSSRFGQDDRSPRASALNRQEAKCSTIRKVVLLSWIGITASSRPYPFSRSWHYSDCTTHTHVNRWSYPILGLSPAAQYHPIIRYICT